MEVCLMRFPANIVARLFAGVLALAAVSTAAWADDPQLGPTLSTNQPDSPAWANPDSGGDSPAIEFDSTAQSEPDAEEAGADPAGDASANLSEPLETIEEQIEDPVSERNFESDVLVLPVEH